MRDIGIPALKYRVVVRIDIPDFGSRTGRMVMPEVRMNEGVRMVIVLFVLMKVLEGCLNERKHQHDVHHDGDKGPHTVILHVTWKEQPWRAPFLGLKNGGTLSAIHFILGSRRARSLSILRPSMSIISKRQPS